MKKLMVFVMVLVVFSSYAGNNPGKLSIGDKAVLTDVKMTDVSGAKVSLSDVKKENGLLVLFSCNTCPFVMKWEGRYNDIKAWADKNKVGMIVLNSNHQKRDGEDSMKAMKEKAEKQGYQFYYVVDDDSQVANAFGGQTTPHAFLFDGDFELAYKGAIDDNYDSADDVKQAYVKDAMSSLSSGKEIAVSETKPVGCGIKRKLD
ncbi:thioredoxin family protein [Maribellus sp. YY47]|uniref:thioredoxin family protein n=1 Tax=Maribellus sp. YY47 TaxID=2929486 RepID=UPI00200087D0|nr:thioredoxin family protein [Maribellus sp. YY47]MCK3683303.1 thioredoxin family protein [Maribellus sp. YY47]